MTVEPLPTPRRINLPNGQLSAVVAGPEGAPALMLGHALGTDHRMWHPQIAALAGSFRVIAPDFRGHGASQEAGGPWSFHALAEDCAAVAAALGYGRVSYAGLSLGGVVGMELALGWPHLVERLVLSNTRCRVDAAFATACARRVAAARGEGMGALVGPTVARWLPPGFLRSRPALACLFHEMFEATGRGPYVALCEELGRLEIWRRLPAITCPTLVVGGGRDHTTPPEVVRDVAALIPGADAVILGDAAHFPNIEAPDRFTAILRDFLGSQAEPGAPDGRTRSPARLDGGER